MSEKLLPQSVEAERGTLGSLLIDPEAMVQVADQLLPDDFYRNTHRIVYAAMLAQYQRQEPSDTITLCDLLAREGTLEQVGGASFLLSLVSEVPTSGNLISYAQIVMQKALFRRLIAAAGRIAGSAYQEASDALEQAEQLIFRLGQRLGQADFTPIREVISACMQEIDALHDRRGELIGVPTGFRPLDIALGGLQRSDLIILAGRPGTGKTSLALSIAAHAAYHAQQRVAICSLEMSRKQLGLRLLAMQSRLDQQRLRTGWVHDEEWERLLAAMETLCEGQLWLEDTAGMSLDAMRSKVRRLHAQHGIDVLIVDYLQLMHATLDGKRYTHREQEIAEISRGLKGIAKELNVPVLALAQLSRAVETRQSKVPQLSDLRESGSLENDADVVLFLYREEMYQPECEQRNQAEIIIAKHRNGPVGSVLVGWEASQTRFYALEES